MRLLVAFLALTFLQCRADHTDDTVLLSTEDRQWINSYGEPGVCEPTATSCTTIDNDKAFIDACVDAGHQAKTCGCSVKCSGEAGYKRNRPLAKKTASEDPNSCQPADLRYLQQIKSTLNKTASLAECITGHVCMGSTVDCTSTDVAVSLDIRSLTKKNCREEVESMFCSSGQVYSFDCPDDLIATLSREWQAAFGDDDKQLRQCFQSYVCNKNEERCAETLKPRAKTIGNALSEKRCSYWYRSYCRLDRDSDL